MHVLRPLIMTALVKLRAGAARRRHAAGPAQGPPASEGGAAAVQQPLRHTRSASHDLRPSSPASHVRALTEPSHASSHVTFERHMNLFSSTKGEELQTQHNTGIAKEERATCIST